VQERLAFVTSEGALALAEWDADRPEGRAVRTLLSPDDPVLLGSSGVTPLSLASPSWAPDGKRLCVSVLYPVGPNQPGATLVLVELNGEQPRTLYAGVPGLGGTIAPGLPHYANWSPDGTRIALLTHMPAGLTLFLLGVEPAVESAVVISGAPLFTAWSPDGQTLLVHRGSDLLRMNVGTAPELESITGNMRAFQMPAWSPAGDRFAIIRRRGGIASLNLMDLQGRDVGVHGVPGRFGALAWSPTGDRLAFAALESDRPMRYRGLWLDALDGSDARMPFDEILTAYFWARDGRRLAFLTPSFSHRRLNWNVFGLEDRHVMRFASFYPAPEFSVILNFFEQYAVSHRFWSPSGDALVLNGSIPLNGTPPELLDSHIYVQPVGANQAPRSVGLGIHPSWAPV
jgi:TolB protein